MKGPRSGPGLLAQPVDQGGTGGEGAQLPGREDSVFDPRAWDLRLAVRLNSAERMATCWVDFALTPEDGVLMDCQEIWFSVG
ncbi:unnamed protein product [Gadus morhua 'NCC']